MNTQELPTQFEQEIKTIDRKSNIRLFIFLAIINTLAFYAYFLKSNLIGFIIGIAFFSYFIFLIASIIIAKKKVALKYDLFCTECKKTPKGLYMIEAYKKTECPYCGNKIKIKA